MNLLDAIGTLLEAIAVCALVFSGGGLWAWFMVWLWVELKK